MALIDIPPYVPTGQAARAASAPRRGFHFRSYQLAPPLDFPRALFTGALTEHARLLELHGGEILSKPLDCPELDDDDRFMPLELLHACSALLVSDGVKHEVYRWWSVDLSYVVQRCRGIVLQLMEEAPQGHGYVVVVAGRVASLHLVRGVAPRRVGEGPTLEIVERDLVVEPWEQWHLHGRPFVRTWWRTPAGGLVASRVTFPRWPTTPEGVTEALLAIRGPSVRRRLEAFVRDNPRARPVAIVETSETGEEIDVIDWREGYPAVQAFPEILDALRIGRPGLDPVLVYAYDWGALTWRRRADSADVALPGLQLAVRPQPRHEEYPDPDEDRDYEPDGTPVPSYWRKRLAMRLSRLERLLGLDAPEPIIDSERELVRKAIGLLDAGDAEAVLAAWPTAARFLRAREARKEAKGKRRVDLPN